LNVTFREFFQFDWIRSINIFSIGFPFPFLDTIYITFLFENVDSQVHQHNCFRRACGQRWLIRSTNYSADIITNLFWEFPVSHSVHTMCEENEDCKPIGECEYYANGRINPIQARTRNMRQYKYCGVLHDGVSYSKTLFYVPKMSIKCQLKSTDRALLSGS
jgi:hypothetical protein